VITYIVVILVIIAVLYGSHRVPAGGSVVSAEDYRAALARLAEDTAGRAGELAAALADASAAAPLDEAASSVRKALTGYQQRLAALEGAADDAERDGLDSARAMLGAAIDDYGWACRIVEAGTYRDNPGMQQAVTALCEHGDECIASVRALVLHGPGPDQGSQATGR